MARAIRFRGPAAYLVALALAFAGGGTAAAADLDQIVAQRMDVNKASTKSQDRIDRLSSENDKATAEYRTVLQRIDALRVYNHQMTELIASQDAEAAQMRKEIDEVELVAREVTPLMLGMIEALDNFVALDVPFLPEERKDRIAGLRELMTRADITDSERYRRITEAYQIESDFGRTIEVYQGELESSGQKRQVEFLRVGRVAFLYQTLDGTETGVWDHRNGGWLEANDSRTAVRKGIQIARKQTAPDLLKLPVLSAEAAK